VWRWDQQEPFGDSAPNEDPDGDSVAFSFSMRFPGQYADAESGLHYNYFRDYDPGLGRFGESDPVGLEGDLNTYAYVGASPLRYVDLFGLQVAPPGGGAVGGAIGGGAAAGSVLGGAGTNSSSGNAIAKGLQQQINKLQKPCCPPCEPTEGTKCFQHDFGGGHGPFPPRQSHFHLWIMEQIPYPSCKCVWKRQTGTRGTVDFAPYFLLDCEMIPSWIQQNGGV